jgi:hypothetical protein
MRRSTRRAGAPIGSLLGAVALALALATPAATAKTAPAPRPPVAATGSALHVGDSSAQLEGTVNPRGLETSYYFQYGPTTAYGAQTPTTTAGSGTAGVKVSQILSGLLLGTTYHYRLVAVSSAGQSGGQDRVFTTKQVPLKFVLPHTSIVDPYGSPFSVEGTLSGTGGADHQVVLQSNPFPYLGSFGNLGSATTTNAGGGFELRVPGLSQNTELRVSTLDALPAYSQVVTVRVAVLVTLRVKSAGRGLVRFAGTVTPAEAGAPVVFQLSSRTGRGEVNVGETTVRRGSASVSRFGAVLSIGHTGTYRALVKVTNGRQVSGHSRTVLVHSTGRARSRRARPGRRR